jgi:homoserine kinase
MFKVKVPATTANMGSGFDTIGMALTLYNEFKVERILEGIELIGWESIPIEENLVYLAMDKVLRAYGKEPIGLRITAQKMEIPVSRGLGSSAACIVAGIKIANKLLNDPLQIEDIIEMGTQMEGHPDNIVPAVVGGLTVSIYEEEKVLYSKVKVPQDLDFAVIIPNFKVSTHEARKVIPDVYSRRDCIFNISRAAMLVAAMNNGEIDKLRVATQDKIHQPYREKLIPNMDRILNYARNLGSKGEVISGSGSTLMAIIDKKNIDFKRKMLAYLKHLQLSWKIEILEVDGQGAKIIS